MDSKQACLSNCERFGRFARYFESEVVPLWKDVYDSLVERARISSGSKVLDAGTGTGEVALRLIKSVGQRGVVVAVDTEDEMLKIARQKARNLGYGNLQLKKMSIEMMELPDASFDGVVGNYSLCCCLDYEAALAECLRVLKPGGRLTYNHNGPGDPLEFQIAKKVFEKYQTAAPTERLQEIRKADLIQTEAVAKYRDPIVTLNLMRSLGYEDAEATITQRVIRYGDPAAYIDRMLGFNWRNEANEISRSELQEFRTEAAEALSPIAKGSDFQVNDEMVFFSGRGR